MSSVFQEKESNEKPKGLASLFPLLSPLLGGGALWLAWMRYSALINQSSANWYQWVQTAAIALVGILCLLATVLVLFDRSSGTAVLKTGLSIVPLLLFANLLVLLARIGQSILEGNAMMFLARLYASPLNKALLIVVGILIVLSILKETEKQ